MYIVIYAHMYTNKRARVYVRHPEDFWDFVTAKVVPVLQGDNLTGSSTPQYIYAVNKPGVRGVCVSE